MVIILLSSGTPYSSSDSLLYDYMSDQAGPGAGEGAASIPSFVSGAQDLVVNEGDTVRLPCQVDRLQVSLQNKYTWLEHESATIKHLS